MANLVEALIAPAPRIIRQQDRFTLNLTNNQNASLSKMTDQQKQLYTIRLEKGLVRKELINTYLTNIPFYIRTAKDHPQYPNRDYRYVDMIILNRDLSEAGYYAHYFLFDEMWDILQERSFSGGIYAGLDCLMEEKREITLFKHKTYEPYFVSIFGPRVKKILAEHPTNHAFAKLWKEKLKELIFALYGTSLGTAQEYIDKHQSEAATPEPVAKKVKIIKTDSPDDPTIKDL